MVVIEIFGEDFEEHRDGWLRVRVRDLGEYVGEWVMVDPYPEWYDKAETHHEGKLYSLQIKDYESGKKRDYVYDGKYLPYELWATMSGYGGKNEVREVNALDAAYVDLGDLEHPEPYPRVSRKEYSDKGFKGLELVALYWQAVALGDEELAELLEKYASTPEGY